MKRLLTDFTTDLAMCIIRWVPFWKKCNLLFFQMSSLSKDYKNTFFAAIDLMEFNNLDMESYKSSLGLCTNQDNILGDFGPTPTVLTLLLNSWFYKQATPSYVHVVCTCPFCKLSELIIDIFTTESC